MHTAHNLCKCSKRFNHNVCSLRLFIALQSKNQSCEYTKSQLQWCMWHGFIHLRNAIKRTNVTGWLIRGCSKYANIAALPIKLKYMRWICRGSLWIVRIENEIMDKNQKRIDIAASYCREKNIADNIFWRNILYPYLWSPQICKFFVSFRLNFFKSIFSQLRSSLAISYWFFFCSLHSSIHLASLKLQVDRKVCTKKKSIWITCKLECICKRNDA